MFSFAKLTLARQFLVASLLIMLAAMVILGNWVAREIEVGVTNRTAAVTALYVDSYISNYMGVGSDYATDAAGKYMLSESNKAALERLLTETALGQQIVSFKIWSPDAMVIFSTNPAQINRYFPPSEGLLEALDGQVVSELSDLDEAEQDLENQSWDVLIETYAPVWANDTGEILAVSEFYQLPDALQAEIRSAEARSWLVIATVFLGAYLLLAGLIGRGSDTILLQQTELENRIAQNKRLHDRVRSAAARTTALNERSLRRVSADLHDGPAQDMALALLRIETITEDFLALLPTGDERKQVDSDLGIVKTALESALDELRSISAGLRLPQIEPLSTAESVRHAVHAHERKTDSQVELELSDDLPPDVPLPVKITLYRILQESLANGYRHAGGQNQRVEIGLEGEQLSIEVGDAGEGFDLEETDLGDTLGLSGMRERVEMLGGRFEVRSTKGRGTTVRAWLPLMTLEAVDG